LIQRREERTERRCPHDAGGINGSGVRRRRVREDVRTKKERLNPSGAQRQDLGKLPSKIGRADQWRMSSMIVTARCDHRRRAAVLNAIGVRVNKLVQLRANTQRERPEKCRGDKARDKCAPAICRARERAHCAAIFCPA